MSEQTAVISLYSINWLVFITEMKCVYCVVRATDWGSSLNGGRPGLIPVCTVHICRLIWLKMDIEIPARCFSAHMSFRENRRCRDSHIFLRQIDSCFTRISWMKIFPKFLHMSSNLGWGRGCVCYNRFTQKKKFINCFEFRENRRRDGISFVVGVN